MSSSTIESISVLADIVTALGVLSMIGAFAAFWMNYLRTKRAETNAAEYRLYDTLDARYVDFQRLAIEHWELDVGEVPLVKPPLLSDEQQTRRANLYQILISTFERGYILCHEFKSNVAEEQWRVWQALINSYSDRAGFREAFKATEAAWDSAFRDYMIRALEQDGPSRSASA